MESRSLARVAAVLLFALASSFPAGAAERVRFGGVEGDLVRPTGSGPFAAIVVLHSCLGPRADREALGAMLANWGYVSLFVDDFTPRGLRETCTVDFPEESRDAVAAAAHLATRPDIDAARIGALGFSQGGDSALTIGAGVVGAGRFRAAAALYPPCANLNGRALRYPTLVIVGAEDSVTPAEDCRRLAQAQPAGGSQLKLIVVPGVAHGFDDPAFAGGVDTLGMRLAYDGAAARRASVELRRFFSANLLRP
ncbi:MAG: dienelactone hydrolase family protein [Bradyrhizobium sp.]|nr:MAG: dienelactone hydrolase family protein [Bradyrhizobium sp.]